MDESISDFNSLIIPGLSQLHDQDVVFYERNCKSDFPEITFQIVFALKPSH